jgi:hypothetical protein
MGQFNIKKMPERSEQQLNDLQDWCGYTQTQIVLIALDRLWTEVKHDRNKRLSPPEQSGYIEIRLRPDQLDLQDEINEKCKGVWHPNPHYGDKSCVVGVSVDTDTSILDAMGVEYKLKS